MQQSQGNTWGFKNNDLIINNTIKMTACAIPMAHQASRESENTINTIVCNLSKTNHVFHAWVYNKWIRNDIMGYRNEP